MHETHPLSLARALIHRHGSRAGAVAQEHLNESLAQGDRAGLSRWTSVLRAVSELRTEARAGT